MKRCGKVFIWVVAIAAVAAVVGFVSQFREAKHHGKPLSYWLDELTVVAPTPLNTGISEAEAAQRRQEAESVIRGLGTNILPELVAGLSFKPSPRWLRLLDGVIWKVSFGKVQLPFLAEDRSQKAVRAFEALGPSAEPAIPELAKMLDQRESWPVCLHARDCLHAIGQPALPVFILSLTNANRSVQGWAIHEIGLLGSAAREAIPILEVLARDTNASCAGNALRALSEVDTNAARLLPLFTASFAITNLAHDAAFALGRIGPSGVRVLLQALMAQNGRTRTAAIAGLQPHMTETSANQNIQLNCRFDDATCNFNTIALTVAFASPPGDSGFVVPAIARHFHIAEPEAKLALTRYTYQNYKLRGAPVLSQAAADEDEEVRREAHAAREALGIELREGGVVRGPKLQKKIAFVFTGHSFAEGGDTILEELSSRKAKASFFFTGEFCTNANFEPLIRRAAKESHYLGPHSDKHLLYCPWSGPKNSLVSRMEFAQDLNSNVRKIMGFEPARETVRFFLPPYEHYNQEIADWTAEAGMTLINFTPGTRSNADYTGEADKNFVSSQAIFDSILKKEREDPHGLNGVILLLHIGAGPGRADKFHTRFGELLDVLAAKGYQFVRVDELLEPKETK